MASDEPRDKNQPPHWTRFVGGPRAIAALLPAVTKPAFRARSAASAQVIADWSEIVGPALAAVTLPRRLSGTTLTIVCAGPVALELQHLTVPLAQRINGHFGRTIVEQFRFVQGMVALEEPRPKRRPAPPIEIPDMAPGELRDALAKLGAAVRQARS
jgi:hypothetical protein